MTVTQFTQKWVEPSLIYVYKEYFSSPYGGDSTIASHDATPCHRGLAHD